MIIFIVLTATLLALLEIQIEGQNGWAQKLPTWHLKNSFKKLLNLPEITGYHIFLFIFVLAIFQFPFFMGLEFNFKNEIFILKTLFLVLLLEDFLWFALNPKWGLKRFFKEEIPWQPQKLLFFPKNYWLAVLFILFLHFYKN
ncbi:hypothetical protein HY085_03430 [Candidatus Gottesmanbacteria bacterium]|nr:hypothetical protein [Candidatus Gottesmanbacteria bacterium]